jgi:hypothetical protein
MPEQDRARPPTTAEALAQWREAERLASVARRGRLAAEAAAAAAEEAAEAAVATAAAARAALDASTMAESSAAKTANAAKLLAQATRVDAADSVAEQSLAEIDEAEARERYRGAVDDASRRA